jgi:hypothetical protein
MLREIAGRDGLASGDEVSGSATTVDGTYLRGSKARATRVSGVTSPARPRRGGLVALGLRYATEADDIIRLRDHGVTPVYRGRGAGYGRSRSRS